MAAIHRVWSTDWFRNSKTEIEKILISSSFHIDESIKQMTFYKGVLGEIVAGTFPIAQELEFLENYQQKKLVNKLKKTVDADFKKIEYSKCIEILEKNKKSFVFNDIR